MCASRLIVTRRISAPIAELWRSFQRDSACWKARRRR